MSFVWPSMLYLLGLVPLLAAAYFYAAARRRKRAAHYGSLGFVQSASGKRPGLRLYVPPALFLASVSAMTLAVARPQFTVSLPRLEGTVILVFDVSGSMAADDAKPTRMEAAKAAAIGFVERQPPGVQVGVVAFSDGGLSIVSPTNEQETLLAAIKRLSPQRGTSLGNGILTALDLALRSTGRQAENSDSATPAPPPPGASSSAVIVVLSDGENNMSPEPEAAAQKAAEYGVRVDTIGFGTPAGVTLQVNGFLVHTALDEAALQGLSKVGGGNYFNAQGENGLGAIYERIEPKFVIKPESMEVTSLLAGLGLVVLIIGGAFSLLWFGRVP
jgi:Ca-activated chloride channel family protein